MESRWEGRSCFEPWHAGCFMLEDDVGALDSCGTIAACCRRPWQSGAALCGAHLSEPRSEFGCHRTSGSDCRREAVGDAPCRSSHHTHRPSKRCRRSAHMRPHERCGGDRIHDSSARNPDRGLRHIAWRGTHGPQGSDPRVNTPTSLRHWFGVLRLRWQARTRGRGAPAAAGADFGSSAKAAAASVKVKPAAMMIFLNVMSYPPFLKMKFVDKLFGQPVEVLVGHVGVV